MSINEKIFNLKINKKCFILYLKLTLFSFKEIFFSLFLQQKTSIHKHLSTDEFQMTTNNALNTSIVLKKNQCIEGGI